MQYINLLKNSQLFCLPLWTVVDCNLAIRQCHWSYGTMALHKSAYYYYYYYYYIIMRSESELDNTAWMT